MANPFVAEIRIVGFTFAPRGWAACDGATLNISQNTALFSLLGTTYGGNGTSTFQLPNLQSRVPIGQGQGPGLSQYDLGETGGFETVTLSAGNIPSHNHGGTLNSTAAVGTATTPAGNVPATPSGNARFNKLYTTAAGDTVNSASLASAGAANPTAHNNIMPFQTLLYIIALQGIFPSRN